MGRVPPPLSTPFESGGAKPKRQLEETTPGTTQAMVTQNPERRGGGQVETSGSPSETSRSGQRLELSEIKNPDSVKYPPQIGDHEIKTGSVKYPLTLSRREIKPGQRQVPPYIRYG